LETALKIAIPTSEWAQVIFKDYLRIMREKSHKCNEYGFG
jgi:hypothetical protein